MAHTDLFTEYTTIAILPVLTGQARLRALARLWGLVYAGNMAGAALFAVLLAMLGPALGVVEREPLEKLARGFLAAPWDVMLLSAVLAGWLMGLLSWLVAAAQETISQIVFIWLVTGLIGLAHLHHSITSTLDVLAAMLMGADIPAGALLGMVAIATLGNALGGLVFAALIRFSLVLGRSEGSRVTRER
ncbi:MAG TPA: formate/nitrite transporter family protein [Burkholderiales bacterium]|nr:formate/nitrite transporter family protein [Burkholderiales bacterium]